MKKILSLFVSIIFCFSFAGFVQASIYGKSGFVPVQAPNYIGFYDIDTTEITAKYKPISRDKEKTLSGSIKDTYKKIKKIEKYISEGSYERAVKEDVNFLPTHIKYYNYFLSCDDFRSAMNEIITIKRLNSIDRILDDNIVSYKLGMLYYLNKNYSAALTYLANFSEAHNPSQENLWYALGDIYFNLRNYDLSIKFLQKIAPNSINYIPAQEILYNSFYASNHMQDANKCAKLLLDTSPVSENYLRYADTLTDNYEKKLNLYYTARELAQREENLSSLILADNGIALIEQNKIDNAVKSLKGFVEKPDWQKISNKISAITEPKELSNRQKNFFKATGDCIKNFKDNDLVKCFEFVNREEEKLTNEKLMQYQKEYELRQREYDEIRRQQEFLERTYYNRLYMDEFYYMRQPYNYFYGNYW